MPGRIPKFLCGFALFAALTLPAGCFSGRAATPRAAYYTLSYPAPPPETVSFEGALKIDRFSVSQAYNTSAMIYSPEAYRIDAYRYHRWNTNPGDMMTDFLVRDFRSSRLFRAAFSYLQAENARFQIDGAVEEFLESRRGEVWKAVLGLSVTLLDRAGPGGVSNVVFQKQYRAAEGLPFESPEGFARGMSAAMAHVSAQVIRDVAQAVAGQIK